MVLVEILSSEGGLLLPFVWLIYQIYWPFTETKLQQKEERLFNRIGELETVVDASVKVLIALSHEVEGIDEDKTEEKLQHEYDTISDLRHSRGDD